jgi:hypothetical protein
LEEDYNADKKIQITLPRLSFEMSGMTYDASRKLNTNLKQIGVVNNELVSQYNPVPYNFDFNLYLYVRNVEDATQILEHIIPFFTPDYTIKLNLIPELGIVKEVPIILNSTTSDIRYEGDRESETRTIIWTLNFTVKGFIFGPTSELGSIIKTSITNIYNDISPTDVVYFNMTTPGVGNYQIGEVVYQGFTYQNNTASAKVVAWNNNQLQLTNIQGNFVSNQPIYGMNTNANYTFSSYSTLGELPTEFAKIVVQPNPTSANANSEYTYTKTITEY